MVYTAIKNRIDNNIIKYQFTKPDGSKLTCADFIQLLKSKNKNFLEMFKQEMNIASAELSAYFWECVPVSQNTTNREFEFVIIKSEALDNIEQDYSNFVEHFRRSRDNRHVVSFLSLSGDTLVVPMPTNDNDYKNITKFADNTSSNQWEAFWQKVGEKMEENLLNANNAPRWLSTSGLGVSYLHVRIDSRPKYYSFGEYRHFQTQTQQANIGQRPTRQRSQFIPWWSRRG